MTDCRRPTQRIYTEGFGIVTSANNMASLNSASHCVKRALNLHSYHANDSERMKWLFASVNGGGKFESRNRRRSHGSNLCGDTVCDAGTVRKRVKRKQLPTLGISLPSCLRCGLFGVQMYQQRGALTSFCGYSQGTATAC